MSETSIKVYCKLRPLNSLEKSMGGDCCVEYSTKNIRCKVQGDDNKNEFAFDGIYGPETSQAEVFDIIAKPVIEGVFDGFNGTIFAYGQTGSGKTFTMEGPDGGREDKELKGIIPRMMDFVFDFIINADENIEFQVKCSFMEIYNEKIQDLIDSKKNNLQIKEDKKRGIFVADATEVNVSSPQQMYQVMQTGSENRMVASTRMNERSSRSHSIFIVHISQKDQKSDTTKAGKLYFVDLAGSEKIAKTNVTGQQLKEAQNINKSLTMLGMVINALTSDKKEHVPYRDSKLTRMLQESLGGNSKTSLIMAASMCSYNDKEILGTLKFGQRAKNIKNQPIKNEEKSARELQILLEKAEQKIKQQEDIILSLENQLEGKEGFIIQRVQTKNDQEPQKTKVDKQSKSNSNNNKDSIEAKSTKIKPENNQAKLNTNDEPTVVDQNNIKEEIKKNTDNNNTTNNTENSTENSKTQKNIQLTVLKQHIQIASLNEEIQQLKQELSNNKNDKTDLENEINARNSEIEELNEKILTHQENYMNLMQKYMNQQQSQHLNFEKLQQESSQTQQYVNKFKRELIRLKSDLNFIMISQSLKKLNTFEEQENHNKINNNEEVKEENEIQEKIYESIDGVMNLISKLVDFNETFESQLNYYKESSIQTNNGEDKNILTLKTNSQSSAQLSIPTSHLSPLHSQEDRPQSTQEQLSTAPDDDKFDELPNTRREFLKDDIFELINNKSENLNIEILEKNCEEALQKIQKISNVDQKIQEFYNLISQQRKQIIDLNRTNQDLSQSVQEYNQIVDQQVLKYKKKFNDINKIQTKKAKEFDTKVDILQQSMNEKIKELKELEHKHTQDINQKNIQLSQLKIDVVELQKIINQNIETKKFFEMEKKIKEMGCERQKQQNYIYSLRDQLNEKEEQLYEKDHQIQLQQKNINMFADEIEKLKLLLENNLQPNQLLLLKNQLENKRGDQQKKNNNLTLNIIDENKNNSNGKQKKQSSSKQNNFFDKNIIKPLRGGGGNVQNFEKNNFIQLNKYDDDEDSSDEDMQFEKNNQIKPQTPLTKNEIFKSLKNFDKILNKSTSKKEIANESNKIIGSDSKNNNNNQQKTLAQSRFSTQNLNQVFDLMADINVKVKNDQSVIQNEKIISQIQDQISEDEEDDINMMRTSRKIVEKKFSNIKLLQQNSSNYQKQEKSSFFGNVKKLFQ